MQILSNRTFRIRLFCLLLICQCSFSILQAQFRVKSAMQGGYTNIRGMSFISPSTGFVALDVSVGFTQDSGATFNQRPITYANTDFNGNGVNLTYGFDVSGVFAFSADSVLVYGNYGAESSILFSANQGQSWKMVFHRPITDINQYIGFTLSDIVFPGNGNIGIAINDKDILRTTNRGQTWTVVSQLPDNIISRFTRLSFPELNNGYAIAGDLLFKSSNAGASWLQVSLPAGNPGLNFNNISFITPSIGYITKSDESAVYKTVNGAASWVKMNDENKFPVQGSDMHFINDSTGLMASKYTFDIYKTTDNGVRWETCKKDNDFDSEYKGVYRLFFYNNDIAWAGGRSFFLALTTNAGGKTKPTAYFEIDTLNLDATGTVHLNNFSKTNYTCKWFRNNQLFATTYNASYQHDFFNPADTIKLVISNGLYDDTLVKYQSFSLPPYIPAITSFSPATGSDGTLIVISGSGFTQVNSVKIGSLNAASFTVLNDNYITAIVAGGATGNIAIADKYSGNSQAGFTYYAPPNVAAPIVNSVVPAIGPPGTMVTISGNNFNAAASGNIISFGAVNAAVISASATQLTCKVPAGASMEPITVLNKTTASYGRSQKPYTVTFADSGSFTNQTFQLSTTIDYGLYIQPTKYPSYSIGKDIDGDGKPDLITAVKRYPDSIAVYKNTTGGKFISFDRIKNTGFVAPGVARFRVEDIDSDGKPDIAYNGDAGVFIARNMSVAGSIEFAPTQHLQQAGGGGDIALADLDGDGKNDIATATGKAVQLSRNTSVPGYLSFGMPQTFSLAENPADIAAADIDGDGKIDIIAHNSTVLTCFRNTSTLHNITMAPLVNFTLPTGTQTEGKSMAVTDFDLDGKLDVIVFDEIFFCVFRNTSTAGTISFASPVSHSLIENFGDGWGGTVANLSGDSKPDILTGSLLLFRNISTPANIVTEDGVYINPHYSSSMNTADFDLDGKMDVISTSINFSSTLIYRNKMGLPIDFLNCSGDAASYEDLQSNIGGASYQWQQDSGTGFKDLTDGVYFARTNTAILTFKLLPSSYNGCQYRCKVDGQYSYTYVMKFGFEWMGWADNNWENPGNWSCGAVPDKYADVIIEGGSVNVNLNAEVRSIYLKPGTHLNIAPGKTFKVLR